MVAGPNLLDTRLGHLCPKLRKLPFTGLALRVILDLPRSLRNFPGALASLWEFPGAPAAAEKIFGFEGTEVSYEEVSGSFLKVLKLPGNGLESSEIYFWWSLEARETPRSLPDLSQISPRGSLILKDSERFLKGF